MVQLGGQNFPRGQPRPLPPTGTGAVACVPDEPAVATSSSDCVPTKLPVCLLCGMDGRLICISVHGIRRYSEWLSQSVNNSTIGV